MPLDHYISIFLYLYLFHQSIHPSSHPSIPPSSQPAIRAYPSLSIPIYLSFYLSIWIFLFSDLSIYHMCVCVYIYTYIHIFVLCACCCSHSLPGLTAVFLQPPTVAFGVSQVSPYSAHLSITFPLRFQCPPQRPPAWQLPQPLMPSTCAVAELRRASAAWHEGGQWQWQCQIGR